MLEHPYTFKELAIFVREMYTMCEILVALHFHENLIFKIKFLCMAKLIINRQGFLLCGYRKYSLKFNPTKF